MRVVRDLEIAVPPPALWAVLWDVPRMAACLPGCTEAREVEPHRRYEARMTQRVGLITLSVPLEVTVRDVVAPASLALEARGRDGALGASVAVSVTLAVAAQDAGSRVRVEAQGKILGKLGALGHGVIQRKAEELIDEFGARLRRAAEGGACSGPSPCAGRRRSPRRHGCSRVTAGTPRSTRGAPRSSSS